MKSTEFDKAVPQACDVSRRRLLFGAGALPLATGVGLSLQPGKASAALKTNARIVIAGSGLGGVAAANRWRANWTGRRSRSSTARRSTTTSRATRWWQPASGPSTRSAIATPT